VPPALSEELRVAVLVPLDVMLTQLMPFQPFAQSVLDPDHRELLIANFHNFQCPFEPWKILLKNVVQCKILYRSAWSLRLFVI